MKDRVETTSTGRPPGHGGQRVGGGAHWVKIAGDWYSVPMRSRYKANELLEQLIQLGELEVWEEAAPEDDVATPEGRELELLRHALGLDPHTGEGRIYRNSYSAPFESPKLLAMRDEGWLAWREAEWMGGGGAWFVTLKGIEAVKRAGPALDEAEVA